MEMGKRSPLHLPMDLLLYLAGGGPFWAEVGYPRSHKAHEAIYPSTRIHKPPYIPARTPLRNSSCYSCFARPRLLGDGPAVGIDLGTTYSCVAVWRYDRGEIIANDQGNRLMPSCVAFTDAERLVGDAAVNQAALNPTNTIFGENCTQSCSFTLA